MQGLDWTRSGLTHSLATRQVTLTYDGGRRAQQFRAEVYSTSFSFESD